MNLFRTKPKEDDRRLHVEEGLLIDDDSVDLCVKATKREEANTISPIGE
jgi:hypothetical protein